MNTCAVLAFSLAMISYLLFRYCECEMQGKAIKDAVTLHLLHLNHQPLNLPLWFEMWNSSINFFFNH